MWCLESAERHGADRTTRRRLSNVDKGLNTPSVSWTLAAGQAPLRELRGARPRLYRPVARQELSPMNGPPHLAMGPTIKWS